VCVCVIIGTHCSRRSTLHAFYVGQTGIEMPFGSRLVWVQGTMYYMGVQLLPCLQCFDVVICLERGADLHTAQLMPLPFAVCCFSKIQIGFTFLVPAHPGSPRQRAVKWVCVCVCSCCHLANTIRTICVWHLRGFVSVCFDHL